MVRAGDELGVVDTTVSDLAGSLGGKLSQEDIPTVLDALERTGAIRWLPDKTCKANGTLASDEGSHQFCVGVRSCADLAWAKELRQTAMRKLGAVERYARGRGCRRAALLRYFGEASQRRCHACDRCSPR